MLKNLKDILGKNVVVYESREREIWIRLNKKEELLFILRLLRDHTGFEFKSLVDITGVDNLDRETEERFEVVYFLLSVRHGIRLNVKVSLNEFEDLDSVTGIYSGGDWLEREVYDMFGIYFMGHKDLRRILTDYGFEGHAMRKDYPLTGYMEVRYDEERGVVSENIEVSSIL